MAKQKPIKIKRPGDLRRRTHTKKGEKISTEKARAMMNDEGLAGQEARYYVNVLSKGNKKRKKGK